MKRTPFFGWHIFLFVILIMATAMSGGTCRHQRGGAVTLRSGTNTTLTVSQGENPSTPTTQNYSRERTKKFVIPAGSVMAMNNSAQPKTASVESGAGAKTPTATTKPSPAPVISSVPTITFSKPAEYEETERESSGATLGAAQDSGLAAARVLGARSAALRPVMFLGIAFILGAGALAYFGWYTKAVIALALGIGVIAVAYFLPQIPTWLIVTVPLVTFAILALLILYAFNAGKADTNGNGVNDFVDKVKEVVGSVRTPPPAS